MYFIVAALHNMGFARFLLSKWAALVIRQPSSPLTLGRLTDQNAMKRRPHDAKKKLHDGDKTSLKMKFETLHL